MGIGDPPWHHKPWDVFEPSKHYQIPGSCPCWNCTTSKHSAATPEQKKRREILAGKQINQVKPNSAELLATISITSAFLVVANSYLGELELYC
jgi:hypothetical protein